MSLDKLTLHHQLGIMGNNLNNLDTMIKQRSEEHRALTDQLRLVTEEITRLHGARAYHNTLIEQINQTIASITKDEAAATTASPTPPS